MGAGAVIGNTKINYLYNAVGVKLKKTVTESAAKIIITDYLGGFQYLGGQLDFMPTAEGYVKCLPPRPSEETGSFSYVYQYKDHLGNVRLNYAWDNSANGLTVLNESHYYPFGLKHEKYNTEEYEFVNGIPTGVVLAPLTGGSSYKYKYNGKELQDELGLNMYDYGARNYDPAIGRWMNIDPLAEQFASLSPYVYAANNPVVFIDPDGMAYDVFGNEEGGGVIGSLIESSATQRSADSDNEDKDEKNREEPPINLFSKDETKQMLNVFYEANKNHKKGDLVFSVFGHGGYSFIANHSSKSSSNGATDAKQFDELMSELSIEYKNTIEKRKAFTLYLYSCNSASETSENISIAQKISKAHPNAKIIGFDGYVGYGEIKGKPAISKVSVSLTYDKKGKAIMGPPDGYIVFYKNGEEKSRELYSEYLKKQK